MINFAYQDFLRGKAKQTETSGIELPQSAFSPALFDFQRDIVDLSLRRGRAAIFADTGLGKGWMALEWLRQVAEYTSSPVLLLAPLAVSQQFAREGQRFGVPVRICRDSDDVTEGVNVANYEKLHKFDPSVFGGVALDESSILKAYDGKTRTAIIDAFRATPFRLSLTATPSPNDHTELGNQVEFLGIMTRAEMLSMFFVHDGETTQEWRLKGHATDPFWKWVASWSVAVGRPSHLGYDDGAYDLPPLREHVHVVRAPHLGGVLFAEMTQGLSAHRDARKATIAERAQKSAELIAGITRPVLIWCDLNAEGDALEDAIPGAVQVTGSQDDETKERLLTDFSEGRARVLITKPSIAGFGLNWQHCADMIFCGVTHSWESYYQSIRRCWRFGQSREVNVHVVVSDADAGIIASLRRKQRAADTMRESMVRIMSEHTRSFIRSTARTQDAYSANIITTFPLWLRENA